MRRAILLVSVALIVSGCGASPHDHAPKRKALIEALTMSGPGGACPPHAADRELQKLFLQNCRIKHELASPTAEKRAIEIAWRGLKRPCSSREVLLVHLPGPQGTCISAAEAREWESSPRGRR
jgi:hypothetical protein